MRIISLALTILNMVGWALWGSGAAAAPELKAVAPGIVVDSHCQRETYPQFWRALLAMKGHGKRALIDADLAMADVMPMSGQKGVATEVNVQPNKLVQDEFLENCVLALLREHVREPIDQAMLQIVERMDQRKGESNVDPTVQVDSLVSR